MRKIAEASKPRIKSPSFSRAWDFKKKEKREWEAFDWDQKWQKFEFMKKRGLL